MAINTFTLLRSAISNWLKRDSNQVADDRLKEFVTLAEDRIYTDLRVRSMEAHIDLRLTAATTVSTVSGTNTVLLTPSTAATAYTLGDRYNFELAGTNTGAVNVNISSLGEKDVKKGEDAGDELENEDWIDGNTVEIVYDGTQFVWVPRGGYPLPSRYVEQRRVYLDVDGNKKLDYMTPEQFWIRKGSSETAQPKMYTVEGPYIIFSPLMDKEYFGKFLFFRRFAALSADSDTNWILTNAPGIYLYASLVEAHSFLANGMRALEYATLYQERIDAHSNAFKAGRFPRGRSQIRSEVAVA